MRVLVIGASGLIGAALVEALDAAGHAVLAPSHGEFDLVSPPAELPACDAAVLTAGPKGFRPCEGNAETWKANVDGPLQVGIALMRRGVQLVFVSTDAVMWSDAAYARQKAHAEIGLLAAGNPAIVRPERVSVERAPQLAQFIIAVIGKPGIYNWS